MLHYGRVEDARTIFDSLVDDEDSNVGYRRARGFFAAMGRDSAQARRDAEWLATLDRPYLRGLNTYWRAAIAGALGELHESLGHREQAIEYYGGFIDMWKSADAVLQPQVEAVRAALERLIVEGR